MVEMKKLLMIIIAVILAVCLLNRQPDLYNLRVDEKNFEIYMKNNNLFYINSILPRKLLKENILDCKIYDIDFDNNDELLIITKSINNDYGKDVVIYDLIVDNNLQLIEIFRHDFSDIKPWKLDACNLDNDGETDIFVGVYKDTLFYKEFIKRPFFYSWDGKNLNKKWLGSYFTDWELVDISFGDYFNLGYDVAAVLEKSVYNVYRIGIYNFIGFGFEHMKTVNIDNGIANINIKEILMKK